MLSQTNIDKLCMTGLYRCNPVLEWLPSYKRDNPYWCKNWTFRVRKSNDNYYMYDTYWATGDEHPVMLTDSNFDKFELIFDFNDVEKYTDQYRKWINYPKKDRFCVAVDSGGTSYPKYFIRKGALPIKDAVIERLKYDIASLESELKTKRSVLQRVENDELDLRYV